MKWSIDTHKYMSEVTRTALKILVDYNITSESEPEDIDKAERMLAEAKVYKDYEGAKGRIRRALLTYFKSYGCMDDDGRLTEAGQAFINEKLSIREFSFWYVVNYIYEEQSYLPTQLVLKFLKMLSEETEEGAYITPYDFSCLVECEGPLSVNEEFINEQLKKRKEGIPDVNERAIGYDVWSKMYMQSGILVKDKNKNLKINDKRLADWLLDSYDKIGNIDKGKINTGVLLNIPYVPVNGNGGDTEYIADEKNAVSSWLFSKIEDSIIDKYIVKGTKISLSEMNSILGLDNNTKSFYNMFYGLERLVGFRLIESSNSNLKTIGELLVDTKLTYDYLENNQDKIQYEKPVYYTGILPEIERNRIVFGAPGTGKSWKLKNDSTELLEGKSGTLERVTFHPDYSYAQFVGTYKPVSDDKGDIRYEFVAGPFMRVYVDAIKSGRTENPQPHILLIEEINRANVAAVFGDVFQLLDRDDDGVSEYEIQASQDVRKYLAKKLGGQPEQWDRIKLPDNMFIWATMNSADQGVYPMDTAFKRRWDFTYLGINDNEEKLIGKTVILGSGNTIQKVEWNKLRRAINNFLAKEKINEDKQLGPYFIDRNIIVPSDGDEIDRDKFTHVFKNKVLMYLFEDAAKQKRSKLFEGCFDNSSRYSEICREFDEKGIGIFYHDIQFDADPVDLEINADDGNE